MELKNNILQCDGCDGLHGMIKFDKKSNTYLCEYCLEESDSLLRQKPKVKKVREFD